MAVKGGLVLRNLKCILPILLFTAAVTANGADEKPNGILFVVRDYSHSGVVVSGAGKGIKTLIEPFAYVIDGKLEKLPNETDPDGITQAHLDQFDKDYYSNHNKYTLYIGGKVGGSIEVTRTAFDIQCESLAAEADVIPPSAISGMRMGLASNVDFKDIDYTRRAPTDDEQATILKLANDAYMDNKVSASVAEKSKISNITAIAGKSGTILIGSFYAEESTTVHPYDQHGHPLPETIPEENVNAVFIIAEKSGNGPYKPTYTWFHAGSDSSLQTQDLLDVLDIDGDGIPEIVTEFGYSEAVEYHVYRKENGIWVDYFKNFGGGC